MSRYRTIPEPIVEKDKVDPGISDLFTDATSPLQLPPEIPPMPEEKPLAPMAATEVKKLPELPNPIVNALEGARAPPTKPPPALRQPLGPVSKPTA